RGRTRAGRGQAAAAHPARHCSVAGPGLGFAAAFGPESDRRALPVPAGQIGVLLRRQSDRGRSSRLQANAVVRAQARLLRAADRVGTIDVAASRLKRSGWIRGRFVARAGTLGALDAQVLVGESE